MEQHRLKSLPILNTFNKGRPPLFFVQESLLKEFIVKGVIFYGKDVDRIRLGQAVSPPRVRLVHLGMDFEGTG